MTIQLRPEQERKVHELIESGRFHTPEDVINQAIDVLALNAVEEIHRRRLLELLEKKGPGWNLEQHPELDRGAAHWVESIRSADDQIDTLGTIL